MEEIKKEKILDDYPLPVTIEKTQIILNQMQNFICKIENKKGNGTGFFCYIPFKNKLLPVLITNNHVINQEILNINKNKIIISYNKDKQKIQKQIIINDNRKIYTSKQYDTTIIEIFKEKDKIDDFLELDDNIFYKYINLFNKSIYVIQYPKIGYCQEASVSYGILKDIQEEYNIIHYCCTQDGSSGSPILNLENNKVIGIHKGTSILFNFNKGTLLNFPIKEFLNNKNLLFINKPKSNHINLNIIKNKKKENVQIKQGNIKRNHSEKYYNNKIYDASKIINPKQKLNINLENIYNKESFSKKILKREKSMDIPVIPSVRKKYKNYKNIIYKFFFQDLQQKFIRLQNITEAEKFEFEAELIKETLEGKSSLKNYCINYIETYIISLFKRKDLKYEEKVIIKTNLETILECCAKDKNTYLKYYPDEFLDQKEKDKKKLIEALRHFRQEFGIKEEDYNDEGIIKRLKDNNYDINKAFQDMFG